MGMKIGILSSDALIPLFCILAQTGSDTQKSGSSIAVLC